jgi:mRNA interferase RelE/StbE
MALRNVAYSKDAAKALRRLPANLSKLIRSKLEQYANDPESLRNNVVKLTNRPGFRLRVGEWRIIFAENEKTIDVRAIRPRGGAYKE